MRLSHALLLATLLASCHRPTPNPHYVLGSPYQADGIWYYPRESYETHETGLAMIYSSDHPELTADGEVFDQSALAAAHQTLQLPAIARLTNLENGRQVVVRINDRGPATPHRLVEVTRRTATLLGFPSDGVARVRLEVLAEQSQATVEGMPDAPKLQLAAAPVETVQQSDLPAPGTAAAVHAPAPQSLPRAAAPEAPPLRLPETVTQVASDPGSLYVRLGTFTNYVYANMQRARAAGSGASVTSRLEGGAHVYRVMIGPLATTQEADAVLDQVLRAGVTDARIVVE